MITWILVGLVLVGIGVLIPILGRKKQPVVVQATQRRSVNIAVDTMDMSTPLHALPPAKQPKQLKQPKEKKPGLLSGFFKKTPVYTENPLDLQEEHDAPVGWGEEAFDHAAPDVSEQQFIRPNERSTVVIESPKKVRLGLDTGKQHQEESVSVLRATSQASLEELALEPGKDANNEDISEDDQVALPEPAERQIPRPLALEPDTNLEPSRISTAAYIPSLSEIDDDADAPTDFYGLNRGFDESERLRLLEEMEAELAQMQENAEVAPYQEQPPDQHLDDEQPHEGQTISLTYRWPTFMGEEAQMLEMPERANLIKMLRNMHDPSWCLQVLVEAFVEEHPDGLRPQVVEAIIHSYHSDNLAEIYTYLVNAENSTDEERSMAKEALGRIHQEAS